jgi:RNA polymerase sigma-70 factor (ECF subfamily)
LKRNETIFTLKKKLAYILFSFCVTPNTFQNWSDEALAIESKTDMAAFTTLLQRYEIPLLQYIMRISHFSVERAEDILQEVFVKVWNHLDSYDPEMKFCNWIYRIAHNETISEFRKAKARKELQQISCQLNEFENYPAKTDISNDVNKKLTSEKVNRALCFLSPRYRSVLVLRFMEDKNYEEISHILGVPPGTVATLLHRAKEILKKSISREEKQKKGCLRVH